MSALAAALLPPEFEELSSSAISEESRVLERQCIIARQHFDSPVSRKSIRDAFFELAETWREETYFTSSSTALILNPSYQRIIGLGPAVVPHILHELSVRPDHWFWALYSITRVNPVPSGAAGDVEAMSDAWLNWGREQGLLT